MKVTFLIPPVLDKTQDVDRCFGCNYSIYFLPLLPALYSATLLKNENIVALEDFPAQGKTPAAFRNFILQDDSDIYVFYTVFLCQNTDLLAREMVRQLRGDVKFIFAGPQPTYSPEVFLDREDSFAVRGEPEFIIQELIASLKSGKDARAIPGVSFYDKGKLVHNQAAPFIADMDSLPIPDRKLLDHKPYFNPKLRRLPHTAILTSRGCYGQCWYCVPNSLSYARELEYKKEFGKKPPSRLHSAKRVIAEFQEISRLGFKSVSIIDDEFLWGEERTLEICEGIKDLQLEWSCLCRPDKINERVAAAMAKAGCSYIDLGTESFDQEVLAAIRKDMLPQDTEHAVHILKKCGIEIELNVLFGATPKETEATIKKTLQEVKRLDVNYVLFSVANPFPGTDFYIAARKEGWLCYGDYIPVDPTKKAIISYPHLTRQRLEQLVSHAYLTYYFNPRYMFKQLTKIRSPKDLLNKVSTAIKFFSKNFLTKDLVRQND